MSAFSKIEVPNSYRGTIVDATVGKSKNGFPQAVIRFRAEEAANEKGEFETLAAQAQITSYFTLFNNVEIFNEQTANLNYTQLQKVGGWEDGKFTFREIPKLNGKKAFFRTDLNEYNGKTSMQVVWVDDYESDGTTTLKPASDAEIDALDSLLKFTNAPAATKPVAKRGRPAKPPEVAVSENPTQSGGSQVTSSVSNTGAAPSVVPPATPVAGSGVKAPPAPPAELVENPITQAPATCTKNEAWEYVYQNANGYDDDAITQAWLGAVKKVGGDQKTYTPTEWARVRNYARESLIPFSK